MTGSGQEIAKIIEDVAKKAGPALAKDFAGAYQKILHNTADGLGKTVERVTSKEADLAHGFDSIGKKEPDIKVHSADHSGGHPGGGGGGSAAAGGGKPPGNLGTSASSARPHGTDPGGQHADGNSHTETGQTDPVDVVSGQVLAGEADLELPGLLPLLLRRAYASGYQGGRLFGPGWSSTVDQRVEVDGDGIRFYGDDAQILRYPVPTEGGAVYPAAGARWPLTWDRTEDTLRIEDPDTGWTRVFPAEPGNGAVRPIGALVDRNEHRITFMRDTAGMPIEVRHSGGYRVAVDLIGPADGVRVAGLRVVGGNGPAIANIPVRRYRYDERGRLTDIVDSSGVPYRYEYDTSSRIIAWIDRAGGRYEYTYDEAGRAIQGVGPDGFLTSTVRYDPARRHTTVTDSLDHSTEYHYDEYQRVVRIVDPLGNETVTERDRDGRVLARTDPLGNATRYGYDEQDNVTHVSLADGTEAHAEYNDFGQPVWVRGPDGAEWRYGYDERGNSTTTTDPAGATTRYGYDERGILSGFTDALGNVTRVEADEHGLVTQVTDPVGGTLRYTRDPFGRIVEAVDSLGVTTRYGWTVEGLPAWQEDADGARTQWTYDAAGDARVYTAPGGYRTTFDYTHFHLPTARTGRDGRRYQFSYDTELRLVAVTDPQGLVWRYEYDAAGRVVAETDFNGRRVSYGMNAAGDLAERVNGAGQRVRYVRDALGRVTERHVGERVTTLSYDGAGRLTNAVGPEARVDIDRDPLGRIVAESVDGRAVRSEFDPLGRRVTRTTPGGQVSRWEYDPAGQPVALTTNAGSLRFGYDAGGREITRSLGPRATLRQTWDRAGRLAEQVIQASPGAPEPAPAPVPVQQRGYAYRADGAPLRVVDRLRGTRQYVLDPVGRASAVRAANWTEQYAYDPTGNPTWAAGAMPPEQDDTGGPREYTGTLVRRAGRTVYEHDGQGRVVSQTRRTLSGQRRVWRYTWDADDRLTDVTTPDGTRWHYRYDPLGRRIAKQRLTEDGSVAEETWFAWDGTMLAEQTSQVTGGPNRTTRTWDYEPGSYRPAAQTDGTGPSADPGRPGPRDDADYDAEFYAIVTDLVGTPSELVDQDGEIAWSGTTDLWGRDVGTSRAGGSPDDGSPPDTGVDCPLRFPGQYHDQETGWHYNYTRYYDPAIGQYTSPDPLGLEAAANPHSYVDNPTYWSDPLGLNGYKSNEQMLADARAIHDSIRAGRTLPGANIAYNGTTVATGEFNGRYVYTMNKNTTAPSVRETATNLGYERINGKKYTADNSTDAEQIMLNAHDKGALPLDEGAQGRIAPSRPACGPKRQDCRGRIAGYPNITLIE